MPRSGEKLTESITFLATPALRAQLRELSEKKRRKEGDMIRLLLEYAVKRVHDHPHDLANL